VFIDVWKSVGWGSIIYLAALAGIDPELYDAAHVDGANRWHKIRYINIPGITSTIIIMFILRMGQIMKLGFEQVFLLYNPATYETADVIATFVYRRGLAGEGGPPDYSFGTAVGLFESVIGLIFLVAANKLAKKYFEYSLW
jgi:putative aldouronate transport system permease protein